MVETGKASLGVNKDHNNEGSFLGLVYNTLGVLIANRSRVCSDLEYRPTQNNSPFLTPPIYGAGWWYVLLHWAQSSGRLHINNTVNLQVREWSVLSECPYSLKQWFDYCYICINITSYLHLYTYFKSHCWIYLRKYCIL